MSDIMLEIKNARKVFNAGTVNEKVAIDGLSLTMKKGDFITVIGGNGAGKSTILNAVAGTFMLDGGTIAIDGENVTDMPDFKRAKYLGRVFQDPRNGTCPNMWIEENLSLAAKRGRRRGLNWSYSEKKREAYREMLKKLDLGLEDRLTTKVGILSGGQRQALTLLMATMNNPKLLLLDEHTAALDPKTAAKVLELTEKFICDGNLTALMVTHNMKDAINYGNRLIMMNNGKIILDVAGEEKKNLTVDALMGAFAKLSGEDFANDRALLG